MPILKRGSIAWSGGVDISNTLDNMPIRPAEVAREQESVPKEPELTIAERLEIREREVSERERAIEDKERELAALKEQYIEQGKEVILEAKRRAEELTASAEEKAAGIVDDAEKQRDSVFIKARAEGFELGRKEGVEACMAAGQDVLSEAKAYSDRINAEKDELFKKYEKEIYETVMEIANKVTLDSMSVKDGTAAKKLIKKAAKEFRNSQTIRITLDKNGATEELAGDYEYLRELCGGAEFVEVELLSEAEAGTVIVDNGSEITDAGIQTQLRMIQELGSGKFNKGGRKKKTAKSKKAAGDESSAGEEQVMLDE